MNGPQVVCVGCGSPTSAYKPFCDDCARFFVEEIGQIPFCALCHAGLPKNEHGQHLTPTGGYAGPCATVDSTESQ